MHVLFALLPSDYAAVSFTDANIGALLAYLDKLLQKHNQAPDDVLVVFHADHGYQA